MGVIEDVLSALERIPLWKRAAKLPEEVEALQKRVQVLEDRLAGKTGMLCPVCNDPSFKVVSSGCDPTFGDLGILSDTYQCSACNHRESRQRRTGN